MNMALTQRPVPRGTCLDCGGGFPMHKARRSVTDPLVLDEKIDIYVCPQCGSYAVEEDRLEQLN